MAIPLRGESLRIGWIQIRRLPSFLWAVEHSQMNDNDDDNESRCNQRGESSILKFLPAGVWTLNEEIELLMMKVKAPDGTNRNDWTD